MIDQAPSPKLRPSSLLADSMTRSSVTISRPTRLGERPRGLLRALQRRDPQVHDVAVTDALGDPLGHPVAEVGEVEPVAAAVEDALGVVHLTVAQQVDDRVGGLAHGVSYAWAAAAARAASGRASSTV